MNNNNNSSANSITLRPVITKKSMSDDGSANSFNNRRKLPSQSPPKLRSTPLTPEKVSSNAKMSSHSATTPPTKKMQSMSLNSSSSRSSASSTADANSAKESVRYCLRRCLVKRFSLHWQFNIFFRSSQGEKWPHHPKIVQHVAFANAISTMIGFKNMKLFVRKRQRKNVKCSMRPSIESKWVELRRKESNLIQFDRVYSPVCREPKLKCTLNVPHVLVHWRSSPNWRRKPIGVANTRNSFKRFAVQRKCKSTWLKVENCRICRHHRQAIHLITCRVRIVNANSMRGLPSVTYQNVQIFNSINRNRMPPPKNVINPDTNARCSVRPSKYLHRFRSSVSIFIHFF